MKKDEPFNIVHYYLKRLHKYAGKIEKGFDEKTIHLFRVDVKKIRSFLRMMRLHAKDPNILKLPREFKKMYSQLGKIRDRQLHLKQISQHELFHKAELLKKEIEELQTKNIFLTRKEWKEIEEKIKRNLPIKITDALVKEFFQQKLSASREIIEKKNYKDNDLHSIRKNIKDIIYILKIFRDDHKRSLSFQLWNVNELRQAEDLAHSLGLFNDACTSLLLLKTKNTTKEQESQQKMIHHKWVAEKRKLKKEILIQLPALKWSF